MRKLLLVLLAVAFAQSASAQNYTATPGSGYTFGAKSIAGVLYPQALTCDPTTPSQCVGVNASGQITVIGSGTFATQSAITAASGSIAAGALASGAAVDGWNLTAGTKTDAACGSPYTGSCSEIALLRALNVTAGSAIPAGTAVIGKVGIDQTTPGTTNGVQTLTGSTTAITAAASAFASGSVLSGAYASGSISDGAMVTLGSKADAKSTATDTTAITIMQVMKEISSLEQAPVSRAVTNAGTFATQSAITAASGSIAAGAVSAGAVAAGAYVSGSVLSGAYASGALVDVTNLSTPIAPNTATATKGLLVGGQYNSTQATFTNGQQGVYQISARGAQYVAVGADGFAVTNAGTFATQSAITAASGSIAAGAVSAGAFVSGSVLSGAYASGSLASGAVVDLTNIEGVIGNATAPTKMALGGLVYNSTPLTLTNGQSSALQGDANGYLNVHIQAGAGSGGTALGDNAAWTAGTTNMTPAGCEYTSGGATAITTAHAGTVGCTSARAMFTDLESVSGTALTAAVSAYGTAPTGTAVMGVNAFITNTNANGSAVSASSSPVVIASDQAAVAVKAASAAFASGSIASGAVASGAIASGAIASGAIASGAAVSGAFVAGAIADLAHGSATAANSVPVVIASNQTAADPCMFQKKTNLAISQNGTSSVQLVALSGSTTIYVCSLSLVAAGATTVALTTGTGTACVTGNAAVIGSTTANIANSISLAANGGLTLGNGGGTVANGAASSELCMILGTNVFVSGNLTYIQQ